jgi:hypothetical protein
MIIAVGLLLATGKLTLLTQSMATGTAGQMAIALEEWLANLSRLGQ